MNTNPLSLDCLYDAHRISGMVRRTARELIEEDGPFVFESEYVEHSAYCQNCQTIILTDPPF